MDWSENTSTASGDEMQHYQEMLAIAIGTGRALLRRSGVSARAWSVASSRRSVEHLATERRFDMGDYRRCTRRGLQDDAARWPGARFFGRDERELVVTRVEARHVLRRPFRLGKRSP